MKDSDIRHLINDPKAMDALIEEEKERHYKDKAAHIVKKLTMDEIRIYDAMEYYQEAQKNPANGMLHRKEAEQIACRLNLCSDDTLMQMAQPKELVGRMDNARGAFMQLARILLKKRGLQLAQGWA